MRTKVNVYPSEAQAHYDNLLAAIGGRPAAATIWFGRRDTRRAARAARRLRLRVARA
jgi:hypothetical protein